MMNWNDMVYPNASSNALLVFVSVIIICHKDVYNAVLWELQWKIKLPVFLHHIILFFWLNSQRRLQMTGVIVAS